LKYYNVIFLDGVRRFMQKLDGRIAEKILFVVAVAQQKKDPKFFKKLKGEIWEFRIRHMGVQIRLLSFWDNSNVRESLVVIAVGFIKKTDKISKDEFVKAENIRKKYFEENGK
jgi:mRNA-degrading endonuclease RelE of RelBE toxin-antitoxin system